MSRLDPLRPDQLDDDQRSLYGEITGSRRTTAPGRVGTLAHDDGSLVGPFDAFLRSPLIGSRLAALGEALRFDSGLDPRLLELAVLVQARHTTAQFEWFAHARLARAAGLGEDVIAAIAARSEPDLADDPDGALVYRFASQLVGAHRVDDDTYRAAVARLGEPAVFELVVLIGYYGTISAVLNTFEVPLPAGVDPLPE
jgi:4-carboxymuconolactone decarboxylase